MKWRFKGKGRVMDTGKGTIIDVWPDVEKTVIYEELLDWGVDAKEFPVEVYSQMGSAMAINVDPVDGKLTLVLDPETMIPAYPTNEDKYVGLVHELAHVRQFLNGEMELYGREKWYNRPHEQDAIRWSARQARLMGWSSSRLEKLLAHRYRHNEMAWRERVLREGRAGIGMHPKQEALTLLARLPTVRVRQHRRRR